MVAGFVNVVGVFGDVVQEEPVESVFDVGVMFGMRPCSGERFFTQILEEVLAVNGVFWMIFWVV